MLLFDLNKLSLPLPLTLLFAVFRPQVVTSLSVLPRRERLFLPFLSRKKNGLRVIHLKTEQHTEDLRRRARRMLQVNVCRTLQAHVLNIMINKSVLYTPLKRNHNKLRDPNTSEDTLHYFPDLFHQQTALHGSTVLHQKWHLNAFHVISQHNKFSTITIEHRIRHPLFLLRP